MSYAMTFLFLAKPSPAVCALRRLGLGTSFAVCYSALFTKTNRIARIFNGVKDGAGAVRPRFISPSSQVSPASLAHLLRAIHQDQMNGLLDHDKFLLFWSFSGVHLSELDLRPVSDGVGVAAVGSSRDTALHTARAQTDCYPQV